MAIDKTSPNVPNVSEQQQINIPTSDPNVTGFTSPNFQSPGIVVGTIAPPTTTVTPVIGDTATAVAPILVNTTPNIGTVFPGGTNIIQISGTTPVIQYTPPISPL